MKFMTLIFYLFARLTLTLTSAFAFIDCFEKVNFEQEFNLVIENFEFPSAFLYESRQSFIKQVALCGNNKALVKIRSSLLCVTNHYVKCTSKLILPSIYRIKLH